MNTSKNAATLTIDITVHSNIKRRERAETGVEKGRERKERKKKRRVSSAAL
jgi:hypothetical protein